MMPGIECVAWSIPAPSRSLSEYLLIVKAHQIGISLCVMPDIMHLFSISHPADQMNATERSQRRDCR